MSDTSKGLELETVDQHFTHLQSHGLKLWKQA